MEVLISDSREAGRPTKAEQNATMVVALVTNPPYQAPVTNSDSTTAVDFINASELVVYV